MHAVISGYPFDLKLMNRHPMQLAITAIAAFLGATFAQASVSEEEKSLGFTSIFDGSNLDGWEQKGNWVIEDGAIFRKEKGGSLVFRKSSIPNDFELRFEWKISQRGNSGVYYRPGQYEYQVLDNGQHPDGRNPRTSAASLYFCMPPARDFTKPVGEWNQGRIVCKGTVIQHWLNGQKAVDFDYTDPRWEKEVELLRIRGGDLSARGAFLSFQDHGDAVWYKAVRIREIQSGEAVETNNIAPASVPEEMLEKEKKFIESKRMTGEKAPK